MGLSGRAIVEQSKNCYNQHKEYWRKNAKKHSKFAPFRPLSDFVNIGIGRQILLVANGYSFEENLEDVKEAAKHMDIMCCDKTLGHLLDHGIKPTYCCVADAKVNYEKYLAPWLNQIEDTILFFNVCANPKWTHEAEWKSVYFFVNHDSIQSEKEFCKISECTNVIPAATNVSNAMVVFLTQSDNKGPKNFFGYDKYLLIGFDYSWRDKGSYYAFNKEGDGKTFYMRHLNAVDGAGSLCFSSTNLHFSSQWLQKYITNFGLPVVQCTKHTLMHIKYHKPLREQLSYEGRPEDANLVKELLTQRASLTGQLGQIDLGLSNINKVHKKQFLASM